MFFSALAHAWTLCPRADDARRVVDLAIASDGAAWVLTQDDWQSCWWIVDEQDDARVAGRWPLRP